jgi:hypothetical protein
VGIGRVEARRIHQLSSVVAARLAVLSGLTQRRVVIDTRTAEWFPDLGPGLQVALE